MKKQYIFVAGLVLCTIGLGGLAADKYVNKPQVSAGPTVQQMQAQRDTALLDLKTQKAINTTNQQAIDNLKTNNTTLANQKATLCAQVKAAKLAQPLCQ